MTLPAPARGETRIAAGQPRGRRALALLAVAATVSTWGLSGVVIKVVSTTGLVASFYRLWLALPLLWAAVLLLPRLRARLGPVWLRSSLAGGSLFALHQVLFFQGLKLTTVANVMIIGALQPALVLLVAESLFGERTSLAALGCSAVAFLGTILVVLGSAGTPRWSPEGDALAFLNLGAFTGYFLFSKRARERVGASEYVVGMTTVAALWILLVCAATGQDLSSPHGRDWPLLLFLAVFPGTLGHFLTNWAHPYVPAFVLSVFLLAVPVIASVVAYLLLGEPLGLLHVAGGILVLGSIGTLVALGRAEAESAAQTDAP
ncbi:MAG: hypothetical protein KatS3mg076_2999 [Candidatus Binatia bacterium]|nr:MAG: hypothetical protein KatS3mg076_2999 [Candidatus Binatia bacterium]